MLIWTLTIFIGLFGSYGQTADTLFYPAGRIKEIKEYQNNQIIRAVRFKEDGEIAYQWDIETKTLKSYDAISYQDTLAEYFTKNCPDHTIYQHYGNGPLMEIENYKNNKRHGKYEKYSRDGKPISKGQFDNWKKVGIWTYYSPDGNADRQLHWWHHNYSEEGISIAYTVYPVGITMMTVLGLLFLFLKLSSFSTYLISYSAATVGIYLILMLSGLVFDDNTLQKIGSVIGRYVFPVLTTFLIWMAILSMTSLIFRKRTSVKLGIAILLLLTSFGLGFHLLYVYIGTKLAGVIVM